MSMLNRREHALGAPKYIINRYNVYLARFKVTLHVSSGNNLIIERSFTYQEIVNKLTTIDQDTLFREGKVSNVEYRGTNFKATVEFIGFQS